MNTNEFLTDRADLESAQDICKTIENEDIRNRAVANVFAVNIASKFFDKEIFDIDTESGLHNIPLILNNYDISDIYINNSYIDVRLTFENDNLVVPLSNFKRDFLPLAYMFIKISADLTSSEVLGFVLPEDINKDNIYENNIIVEEDSLKSFYDVEPFLVENTEYVEITDSEIFSYLDGSSINNIEVLKKLVKSKDARLKLAKATKAQSIFNFISLSKDEISNNVAQVNIISSQEYEEDTLSTLEEVDSDIDFASSLNMDENTQDLTLLDTDHDSMILEEFEDINLNPGFEDSNTENNDNFLNLAECIDHGVEVTTSELDDVNSENLENNSIFESSTKEYDFTSDVEMNKEISSQENILSDEILDIENNREEEDFILNDSELNDIVVEHEDKEYPNELIDNNYENETESKSSDFDFKTNTTPNLELDTDENDNTYAELLEESSEKEIEHSKKSENILKEEHTNNNEQLDSLFEVTENNENINNTSEINLESGKEAFIDTNKKKNSKIMPLLGIVTIIGALGYLGYSKFFVPQDLEETSQESSIAKTVEVPQKNAEEAMPIETINENINPNKGNEGNAIEIPAIEQNLDASILVSNLKVDWEVPSGYVTNNSAKRYLVKLGKIIQLNLKTELLLLNKPPITNKIAVEIRFNKDSKKFETVGITISSGEQAVDDLILKTVKNALALNLSLNSDSFSKLQGNPVLVIHL